MVVAFLWGGSHWPDCASVSPPPAAERRGRLPGQLAGRYPRLVATWGGSCRWWFLLQMQSRAAAPGRASARTRRTANPSRWVRRASRARASRSRDTWPCPQGPCSGGGPLDRRSCPLRQQLPPAVLVPTNPSQLLPGTCNDLGMASASSHSQQSPVGAVSLGDSSCHGGPIVGVQPPALPVLSAAGKLRHGAAPGCQQLEGTSWGGSLLEEGSGAKLAEEGGQVALRRIWGCWGALKHRHKTMRGRRSGPVLPPALPPLSHADSTDFQESFVTSGVFSVTELIQVSRSECHHDATPPQLPGHGSILTAPPSQLRAGAPLPARWGAMLGPP